MSTVSLKDIKFGGVKLSIPEVWNVITEAYTEPDGRECAMIDIAAEEGDPRSIVISYGPMPEGSDAIMEAGGTYEELIGEIDPEIEEDPLNEYDFLGTTGYGFEVSTEDNMACNFICVATGSQVQIETGVGCKLFTILTTARSYEDIDDLLDLVGDILFEHQRRRSRGVEACIARILDNRLTDVKHSEIGLVCGRSNERLGDVCIRKDKLHLLVGLEMRSNDATLIHNGYLAGIRVGKLHNQSGCRTHQNHKQRHQNRRKDKRLLIYSLSVLTTDNQTYVSHTFLF